MICHWLRLACALYFPDAKQIVAMVLAMLACASLAGCGDKTPPAKPLSTDEQVLLFLDHYDPIYKLDARGRVSDLKMEGRILPDAVLAEIGKLSELQGLSLYGAVLSDEGLANLKDLQNLLRLGIGNTPITDKGLAQVAKLQSLHSTWVPKANLSEEAIDKLKKALPQAQVYFQ
jgi:hypothetical protein